MFFIQLKEVRGVGSRKLKEKKVEEIKTNLQDSKVIVLTIIED